MKSLRHWSLASRINAVILLLMLFAAGVIGAYLYYSATRLLSEEIDRSSLAAVKAAAERINRDFAILESTAREMALALQTIPADEQSQLHLLRGTLENLNREIPAVCSVSISYLPGKAPGAEIPMLYAYFDKSGELRQSRLENAQYPYLKYDWFRIPQLLDRAIWTEPYRDPHTGVPMSTRSQPIRNANNEFIGMIGFDLSLKNLSAEVAKADAFGFGQEFLLSRFGRFVAFPEDPSRTRQLRDEAAGLFQSTVFSYADLLQDKAFNPEDASDSLRRLARAMLAGESGVMHARIFNREAGTERLFYVPLPNPGWSLGVAYPERRLLAPIHVLVAQVLPALAILLLTGMLGAWVLVRRMTEPLMRLTNAAQAIGEGNFSTQLPKAGGHEVGRLTSAFYGMQQALTAYVTELKSSTATQERIEKELELAQEIQQGILPKIVLESCCGFSLFAKLFPARRVGGDLYDFFQLDEAYYCFVIGDVVGEGVPAALQMAVVQTLQRGEAAKSRDPGEIVGRINDFLNSGNTARPVMSYLLGVFNRQTGVVRYTNAGHRPPFIRRSGGALELLTAQHGPAVGSKSGVRYESGEFRLATGDTLALYTDGVTEALAPSGKPFGSDALLRVAAYRPESTPAEMGGAILDAVRDFIGSNEPTDDIALLIIRFDGLKHQKGSADA